MKAKHFWSVILLVLLLSVSAQAKQFVVTESQAHGALLYGMQYVEHEVLYLFGGRLSVEDYLRAQSHGRTNIGVDASAVVVNSYRAQIPGIHFFRGENSNPGTDTNSTSLYRYNSKPLTKEEVVPGDLVFFKNSEGTIIGVGLFSHFTGDKVAYIVASPNRGKVDVVEVPMSGPYWQGSFAGFFRLQYTLLD